MDIEAAVGSVMALGGAGASAQVGLRLIGMMGSALARSQQAHKEQRQEDLNGWQTVRATIGDAQPGEWVYRMFAVACVFIVLSPTILPLFWDVTLHYFVPKEHGFFGWFSFDRARLTEYTIPSEQPVSAPAIHYRHVTIMPYMVSFAANTSWFYICGRPLKHRF